MIPFFDAASTTAALPFPRLIAVLRDAFTQAVAAPQRHAHALPSGTLLLMPAWTEDAVGVKIVTVHPGNPALGIDAVHSTYLLSDARTGEPRALIEGDTLTARRTAAASALAASFLAVPEASRMLLVGAGRVASLLPEAHRTVRPIGQVMVWNRGVARRDALIAQLRTAGFEAVAVDDLAEAVPRADIISCATVSETPIIQGTWLRPGQHLDLVGAFRATMREADETAVRRAAVYADTPAALTESGELAGLAATDLAGTLATLCTGGTVSRGVEGITLFKSVGSAIEDLAAATLVAA